MYKVDEDITPVKVRKCKTTKDAKIIDTNTKRLYVFRKQDHLHKKPKLFVLQPIKSGVEDNNEDEKPSTTSGGSIIDVSDSNDDEHAIGDSTEVEQPIHSADLQYKHDRVENDTLIASQVADKPISNKIKFEPIRRPVIKADKAVGTYNESIKKQGIDKGTQIELSLVDDTERQIYWSEQHDHKTASKSSSQYQQQSCPVPGQVKKCLISVDDFPQLTEIITSKTTTKRSFTETLEAEYISKLTLSEYDLMKNLIQAYHDEYTKLKNVIQSLEIEVIKAKIEKEGFQKRPAEFRKMTRVRAFEMLTNNMSEDAKMFLWMQVEHLNKKVYARKFTTKEKLFSRALYKCSKEAYDYLSKVLALPKPSTLDKFTNELLKKKKPRYEAVVRLAQKGETANVEIVNASTDFHDSSFNNRLIIETGIEDGTEHFEPVLDPQSNVSMETDRNGCEYVGSTNTVEDNNEEDVTPQCQGDVKGINRATLSNLDIQTPVAHIEYKQVVATHQSMQFYTENNNENQNYIIRSDV